MNKTEFIKGIAEKADMTMKDATAAYDAFVDTVTEALKEGDKVALLGFVTIELRKKAARTGINPQTKEKINIPASKSPNFKVSKTYKGLFN
ncbi:MAG: HU family DNA-binding protein [Clostridia bacterium]|jgi:DNA-binding protein HU-beta|nr:HU family DNA-binding protein [Clostridia bacterium]MDD3231997.1 HU family DNA-binding protein [Clostridia bacterium]MDD3862227.1 HU family DNA-binding protein [Clostridia bacterium]MDD4408914.1 HU family DNA-binding protein [Clostridia bacterium]